MNSLRNNRLWARFEKWFVKHRKSILITLGAVVVVVGGVVAYLVINHKPIHIVPIIQPAEKPKPKFYSPLTGDPVADEAATKQAVTGIMIENSPSARPQSGLKNSGIVFEAIAEGGITRFLVLYQQQKPQTIGPVRSLRLYDIDWFAPFDASICHVGGSAAALNEVRNGQYRDLDQFFNADSYWRVSDRPAPHNVYTSFDKIDALNQSKGYTTSTFTGFPRTDGKPVKKPDAGNIDVTISSTLYNSSYTYDAKTNKYARFEGGVAHLDREEGQITPSVVITMHVDETTVLEDGYRESIVTTGSGKAEIFQNGTVINGTWSKSGTFDQLKFSDEAGNELKLVRGQTWISAVPNDGGRVTWQ